MDCRIVSFSRSSHLACNFWVKQAGICGKNRPSWLRKASFLPLINCSMKSYKLSELTQSEVDKLKSRPRIDFVSIFSKVQPIVDDVCQRGDSAVKELVSPTPHPLFFFFFSFSFFFLLLLAIHFFMCRKDIKVKRGEKNNSG